MLVEAGLSPYEAIEAGTSNAAAALGKQAEFGTIGVGKRADLILVNSNPLEDVSSLQERSGVMLNGLWLPEDQLRSMLDGLEDSFRPTIVDRIWPLIFIAAAGYLIYRRIRRSPEGA